MRARLLISAAAAACLVLPIAVEAQAQPGQARGDQQHPDRPGHQAGHPAAQGQRPAGQAPAARSGIAQGTPPGRGVGPGGHGPVAGAPGVRVPPGQIQRGQGRAQGGVAAGPGFPGTHAQPGQPRVGQGSAPIGPTMRRSPNGPALGGWHPGLRGPDRDQAGQQWRQSHRGWDNNAPWRRDRNWWRGNSAFRLFLGARLGYFFVPELGYIAVPPQYEHRRWAQGDHLPSWFWRYVVRDYWNYGLPEPPPGCIWVWAGNDVALIDTSDGYILDIVYNVW